MIIAIVDISTISTKRTVEMTAKNDVICLFEGYSVIQPENKNQMFANCTCTIIKSKSGNNILIDTMTPWDRNKIVQGK